MRSVTEEQRRQQPARAEPEGCWIFSAAAANLQQRTSSLDMRWVLNSLTRIYPSKSREFCEAPRPKDPAEVSRSGSTKLALEMECEFAQSRCHTMSSITTISQTRCRSIAFFSRH